MSAGLWRRAARAGLVALSWGLVVLLVPIGLHTAGSSGGGGDDPPPAALPGTAAVAAVSADDGPPASTIVSLTFDDGYASQVKAARALAERGVPATFYLNSGQLGARNYMDPEDVQALVAMGHEVGGHTVDHDRLTEQSPTDERAAICDDRAALQDLGATVTSFAYPYGSWDEQAVAAVQDCGYTSARQSSGLNIDDGSCSDCPRAEDLDPLDHRFNIRTPSVLEADDGLAAVQQQVVAAERTGGWLVLVLHHICDGCSEESTSLTELEQVADWLEKRPPSTVVRTVGQVTAPGGTTTSGPPVLATQEASPPAAGRVASADLLGVKVDQLRLLGGGVLVALVALVVHRLLTRGRRHPA